MINLLQIFIEAFGIGLSGAAAPGPLLTYTIQSTCKKGFWVGPQVILGHAVLEAILVAGLLLGLGKLITLPIVTMIIGLLGGLMLLWMGYDLIWVERKKEVAFSHNQNRTTNNIEETASTVETLSKINILNLSPFWVGILMSLSNPYWLLWWAVLGSAYIMESMKFGLIGVIVFYIGHISADFGWYTLISGAIAKGRNLLTESRYRWLLLICGLFLVFLGLKFIWDALKATGLTDFLGETIDLFKNNHVREI